MLKLHSCLSVHLSLHSESLEFKAADWILILNLKTLLAKVFWMKDESILVKNLDRSISKANLNTNSDENMKLMIFLRQLLWKS